MLIRGFLGRTSPMTTQLCLGANLLHRNCIAAREHEVYCNTEDSSCYDL